MYVDLLYVLQQYFVEFYCVYVRICYKKYKMIEIPRDCDQISCSALKCFILFRIKKWCSLYRHITVLLNCQARASQTIFYIYIYARARAYIRRYYNTMPATLTIMSHMILSRYGGCSLQDVALNNAWNI